MSSTYKVQVNKLPVVEIATGEPKTLLQALESAGLELSYHCRTGFCGACRSTLKSGEVEYLNEPLAYIRPGEILPCICVAKSDLTIDH
ncbi:MAG TPA: class I ribonucleotide reductase maintenance protein YfaE [Aliidiomarina sp.]|nr:class I ribonucleotide reductase maintenance protein YfaE [Aliidiomarina sp.]